MHIRMNITFSATNLNRFVVLHIHAPHTQAVSNIITKVFASKTVVIAPLILLYVVFRSQSWSHHFIICSGSWKCHMDNSINHSTKLVIYKLIVYICAYHSMWVSSLVPVVVIYNCHGRVWRRFKHLMLVLKKNSIRTYQGPVIVSCFFFTKLVDLASRQSF